MKFLLFLTVLFFITSAAIVNYLVYANRPPRPETRNPLLPPGWAIGTVWMILFALLGCTWFLVKDNIYVATYIVIVYALCILYPWYTELKQGAISDIMNFVVLITTFVATYKVWEFNHATATLMVPLIAWMSYINALYLVQM